MRVKWVVWEVWCLTFLRSKANTPTWDQCIGAHSDFGRRTLLITAINTTTRLIVTNIMKSHLQKNLTSSQITQTCMPFQSMHNIMITEVASLQLWRKLRMWKNLLTRLGDITNTNFKITVYKSIIAFYIVVWCNDFNLKSWNHT